MGRERRGGRAEVVPVPFEVSSDSSSSEEVPSSSDSPSDDREFIVSPGTDRLLLHTLSACWWVCVCSAKLCGTT